MAGFLALIAVAAALLVGRHGSAVAAPVSKVLAGPESAAPFGVGPVAHPFRDFVPGASFIVQSGPVLQILGLVLLLVAAVGIGLAALYLLPWSRRRLTATGRMSGRGNWPDGSGR